MNEKCKSTEVGKHAASSYAETVLKEPGALMLAVNGMFRAMFKPICVALAERGLTPVVELRYDNEAIAAPYGSAPTVPAEQARVHIGVRALDSGAEVACLRLASKDGATMRLSHLTEGTPSHLLALIAMGCENHLGWDGGLLDEPKSVLASQAQEIRWLIASKRVGYQAIIERILMAMGFAEARKRVDDYFNAFPQELEFLNFDAWGRFGGKQVRSVTTSANCADGGCHLG